MAQENRTRKYHLLLSALIGVISVVAVGAAAVLLAGEDTPEEELAIASTPTSVARTTGTSATPAPTRTPTATATATASATPGLPEGVTVTPAPLPTEGPPQALATATAAPETEPAPTAETLGSDGPLLASTLPINCNTPLQELINSHPEGSSLDLTGCAYDVPVTVSKPITLIGGSMAVSNGSPWTPVIRVESDNVRIQGWTFTGGGTVVSILGRSNVVVSGNTFQGQNGSAIAIWGEGRGSHNVVIEGNYIVQTKTSKVSPIIARASEGGCSAISRDLTIAYNTIDQGEGDLGWFGVELKCQNGVRLEGNTITGGSTLISLPDTNNVTVVGNTLDLTGSAYWGVEVPKANDVHIEGNTFLGDGPNGRDHAVSTNSGSVNTVVVNNTIQNVRTAVDTPGSHITVTGNCLINVLNVFEYETEGPFSARHVEDNEGCSSRR